MVSWKRMVGGCETFISWGLAGGQTFISWWVGESWLICDDEGEYGFLSTMIRGISSSSESDNIMLSDALLTEAWFETDSSVDFGCLLKNDIKSLWLTLSDLAIFRGSTIKGWPSDTDDVSETAWLTDTTCSEEVYQRFNLKVSQVWRGDELW